MYMKPDANYVSRSGMNKVVGSGSLLLLLIYTSKMAEIIAGNCKTHTKVSSLKIDLGFFCIFRKLIGIKICRNYAESYV